jgi:hypothetical protein
MEQTNGDAARLQVDRQRFCGGVHGRLAHAIPTAR